MIKTATITYHASHNYGSVLQAYSLQSFLNKNGIDNEIINLRTDRQKDLYSLYTKRKGFKFFLKNLSHFFHRKSLTTKIDSFEDFIKNRLILSPVEYRTLEELKFESFKYDVFISGGDQIWNPVPLDFDWAYYLPFVKKRIKISYAVSFGQLSAHGDENIQNKIAELVDQYNAVGVREKGSYDVVKRLSKREPTITLDPVFLLDKRDFEQLEKPINKLPSNGYILLYTLLSNSEIKKVVKYISKKTRLPIVTTNFSNQYDVFNNYIKHYEAGPQEFLYLLDKASIVVTSSFHGSALSIVYKKKFYSIGGSKDARISSILNTCGISNRCIDISNYKNIDYVNDSIDYSNVDNLLTDEKERSKKFLLNAILRGCRSED